MVLLFLFLFLITELKAQQYLPPAQRPGVEAASNSFAQARRSQQYQQVVQAQPQQYQSSGNAAPIGAGGAYGTALSGPAPPPPAPAQGQYQQQFQSQQVQQQPQAYTPQTPSTMFTLFPTLPPHTFPTFPPHTFPTFPPHTFPTFPPLFPEATTAAPFVSSGAAAVPASSAYGPQPQPQQQQLQIASNSISSAPVQAPQQYNPPAASSQVQPSQSNYGPSQPQQPGSTASSQGRTHPPPVVTFDFAPGTLPTYCSWGVNPIPVYNTPYKKCIPNSPLCGLTITCIYDIDPITGEAYLSGQQY